MLLLKEQHLFELDCHLCYLGEKKVMKERGRGIGESQSTTEHRERAAGTGTQSSE